MKIDVQFVGLADMRYPTLGDYFYEGDTLKFKIVDTGNDFYNKCILVHEIIEEALTREKGIKEEDINKFDLWFEQEVNAYRQPEDAEPGDHKDSVYRREHILAEIVEALMLNNLGISFGDYNDYILKTF